jgi:hypothetical protein
MDKSRIYDIKDENLKNAPGTTDCNVNDFLAQHVGIGEIVGFFEACVSEAEDVEAGFVAIMR